MPTSASRWGISLAGLAAVAVCAAASVILIRLYMISRPFNISPLNSAMASHIEDLLAMCHLPDSSVLRHDPVIRRDQGATWTFYAFDVGVPANMAANGVITTLKQGMALQNVSIAEAEAPSASISELRFSMLNREFAVVRIMGGAERYELRSACDELADGVRTALAAAPDVIDVAETAVDDRQDGPARWRSHTLHLNGGPSVSAIGLRELLSASLLENRGDAAPEIAFETGPGALQVFWRGRPVVRVDIEQAASLFVPSEQDFVKDPWLLYRQSPLVFRCLYGFDPGPSDFVFEARGYLSGGAASPLLETVSAQGRPRAAIIVDDGGHGGLVSDAILTMDPRLTLAILPGTPFASDMAQSALSRGFELLLHMPLESGNGNNAYPGELTTAMGSAEIERRLLAALDEIQGAKGMNNHTGSKFTADKEAMRRLLQELKKHGLFFVDSRTTAETVAEKVARELEVPVAARSVFLDEEADPGYMRNQIAALAEAARTAGSAIGICHFRSTTAAMLPEMVRYLETHGVSLVHVSELVQ
ncbi:MAG TPA: divergent polysaccharide deacetylase family protein [Candidatus Hydrogenedentes bacterium]|nr:divergent polysaccharide deacetylase family protein [Candidatus Hydrogenedentota bacterium]HQE83614.1 divergent polysaccharide deacetylase family protein [Candidatus Hydrogenedentota bacterium]